MSNVIQKIRTDIFRHFDPNALVPNSEEIYYSPDSKYFFVANLYRQVNTDLNWTVAKIEIFLADKNEKIFEFIRNDDSLFHSWLNVDNKSYLLLSEDIEGMSIYNLTDREFYSYSFGDDQFIWAEYYPSPDNKKLAVMGCYWACPYELVVYDTSNPIDLPYKELYREKEFIAKVEWLDNATLQLTGTGQTEMIVKVA